MSGRNRTVRFLSLPTCTHNQMPLAHEPMLTMPSSMVRATLPVVAVRARRASIADAIFNESHRPWLKPFLSSISQLGVYAMSATVLMAASCIVAMYLIATVVRPWCTRSFREYRRWRRRARRDVSPSRDNNMPEPSYPEIAMTTRQAWPSTREPLSPRDELERVQ